MVFSAMWARVNGLSGSILDVEAEAEEFHRLVPAGKPAARSLTAALLGRAALSRGHVQRAGHFLREAVLRARTCGVPELLVWPLTALAQSAALAGDMSAAEKALGEAEQLAPSTLPAGSVDLALARAWVVAARGEVHRAATLALGAADDSQAVEFAALAVHDAARLGASPAAADRLVGDAAQAGGQLLEACAVHALALRDREAPGLIAAAGQFERLGADLLAAEAWTEASAVHRAAGRRPEAAIAGGRAQDCLDRCEGARTPALIPEVILAPSLTPRQREVVRLVAMGLSNREVAGKLYVSLRTVENHLYQAYVKLDVSDRRDLARRLCATG